jgi:trimeric autotransporter adhesin
MKTTTLPLKHLMNRSPLRAFLLIPFVLACYALSPTARAVCQEGCDTAHQNTFLGENALISNTTGINNTAIGEGALQNNATGNYHTAIGWSALYSNTISYYNVAVGMQALSSNTTGSYNTATGGFALVNNTIGSYNTATGYAALINNSTGGDNTAIGASALFENRTGYHNTAIGFEALFNNTIGYDNTATGEDVLYNNRTGYQNTANGVGALFANTTGSNNTATGSSALGSNTTGSNNIGIGSNAGFSLTTGSNNIDIGNAGVAGESNRIRIGTVGTQTVTFIAGISGAVVAGGVGVIVGTNGKLGTVVSSVRFKDQIKPMDKASEAILSLQPVTFRYKHELDPAGIPQFGLVAEDVEKVNPDLVARDDQGKPYSVRYEAVNAMLLNEFLKEHRTVQEQQKEIDALKAELKEQRALIQKVNDKWNSTDLHRKPS